MNKQDYTINETFTLPSKGFVYASTIAPDITLRSMTTQEEMKRLSHSDLPYKNMCEIIDDCIVSDCGISSYDMCLADYRFLLYMLRVVTYGPAYKLTTTCPYCGTTNNETVDLLLLDVKDVDMGDIEYYSKFELPITKSKIELKLQTPRMVDTAQYNAKEFKKRSGSSIDSSTVFVIQELIKTIDDEAPNRLTVTDWIRSLPMADTNTILTYADRLNDSFGVNSELHCLCDICGVEYYTALRSNREFFRPTLDI